MEKQWRYIFQALEIEKVSQIREVPNKMPSLSWENMPELIKGRDTLGWGKLVEIPEKKNQFGMGYKLTNIWSWKDNQRKFYTL